MFSLYSISFSNKEHILQTDKH